MRKIAKKKIVKFVLKRLFFGIMMWSIACVMDDGWYPETAANQRL